jgi:hypothetical protein
MCDDWDRPGSWERISSDGLPEPDYDEYLLPDPDDLERIPAAEFESDSRDLTDE